jgi:hypothetical protein
MGIAGVRRQMCLTKITRVKRQIGFGHRTGS